tara:strand:+ start:342 stop:653 length:312 start_codon:yes stop_codon:yes gene_type:complete
MKKTLILLIFAFLLTGCKSAKDAFTLKKKSGADEFLVEKKNPLVLPPEYGKLPIPEGEQMISESVNDNDIKTLVNNDDKDLSIKKKKKSKPTSIEKSILEKIK